MSQPGHGRLLGFARRLLLVTLIPAVAAAGEVGVPTAGTRLDDVVVVTRPDATTIRLETSSHPRYQVELIDGPARLILDLEDTTFAWKSGPLDIDRAPLKQVRGSQFRKGIARVVVEFTRRAPYTIDENAQGLVIAVPNVSGRDERAPVPTSRPRLRDLVDAAPAAPVLVLPAQSRELPTLVRVPAGQWTDMQPTVVPRGPIVVGQAAQAPQAPPRPAAPPAPPAGGNGRLISLDFKDADVVNLLRILAAESGKNIVIADDVKGKMSITLKNVPWEQALDIILESRGLEKLEKGNVIRIVTRDQLARDREAIAKIEEARAKAESAKAQAEAEIRTKVAEAALKEQQAQQAKLVAEAAIREQEARGPLVEETIRLAYADPDDIAKTLIGLLGIPEGGAPAEPSAAVVPPAGPPFSSLYGAQAAPGPPPTPSADVLAKGITIKAHKPTNSIFIRHYRADVERIKKLVRETLDVQLPQIKIEARLNELTRTDLFEIGVQWGGAGFRRDGSNVLVTRGVQTVQNGFQVAGVPFNASEVNPAANALVGPGGALPLPTILPALEPGANPLPFAGNVVNIPPSSSVAGIGFGIIGTRFSLNLALQALESQGKTRSLSRPEIVTVENAKASIALGTEIPFATVSSAGTQIQFKEAALRLEVTPTVIREPGVTKVKMKVIVENNEPGTPVPVGTGGTALPITKRRAETEVVVREGEWLVLGGVHQRSDVETIRKVPLFGDIPILGWLFKAKARRIDPDRELVIFITPTVLKDPPRGTGPTSPPVR
ncbi:MAG: AMIN domain-containing protein [Candidatus Rokubacteria bacterium]|nr:AMIN domain-containing protein [Candidatus Rokubacteria bacterium]